MNKFHILIILVYCLCFIYATDVDLFFTGGINGGILPLIRQYCDDYDCTELTVDDYDKLKSYTYGGCLQRAIMLQLAKQQYKDAVTFDAGMFYY